jgi:hypothetical protein
VPKPYNNGSRIQKIRVTGKQILIPNTDAITRIISEITSILGINDKMYFPPVSMAENKAIKAIFKVLLFILFIVFA